MPPRGGEMRIDMRFVQFVIILVMAVRCASYGIAEFRMKNYIGGIAVILLALSSIAAAIKY